ncbi:MAG: hypothetical protein RBR19_12195 [Sedimentisphaerales bacterium]|jgi:hypothetical protein|nr:hypothetical protein [Planctomycetota bacterium]MDY0356634.1 hypothetical protein [Sedimentisphaerales bacterium]NLT75518.1 hypothetical protein [Planctomycetota bacterium]
MVKRALFIAAILLIVSSVTLAGPRGRCYKSPGAVLTQSTSVVVSQGSTICGTGVAYSGASAGANGYQVAASPKGIASQSTTSGLQSDSFLSVFWGQANAYFSGAVNVFQNLFQ